MSAAYDGHRRPAGNNADEWNLYLSEWGATPMVAVQIAEAIDDAERQGCGRTIARMGWAEIDAFHAELRRGQGIDEDAGGFFLRAIRRLFGLPARSDVVTYQDAAAALVKAANDALESDEPECTRCGCTDKPLHEGYCPECCR